MDPGRLQSSPGLFLAVFCASVPKYLQDKSSRGLRPRLSRFAFRQARASAAPLIEDRHATYRGESRPLFCHYIPHIHCSVLSFRTFIVLLLRAAHSLFCHCSPHIHCSVIPIRTRAECPSSSHMAAA